MSRFVLVSLVLLIPTVSQIQGELRKGSTPAKLESRFTIDTRLPAIAIAALDQRMPLTRLTPAIITKDLCLYRYPVTTSNPACQEHINQSLGYYYSYVYMEAARSAETAVTLDPQCAYGWLCLHRALERWGQKNAQQALEKAKELMPQANHREQMLIQALLQDKGMWPNTPPSSRRSSAIATLDSLLTIYDDDEEGWFARAQLSNGPGAVVFYKALLRINPLHPGASHELVHFFENYQRPALGWPYAQAYMASTPGIAHSFHMQAHLAMRIGKWAHTCDWSAHAIELERAYHKSMNLNPKEDSQFDHHLETLMRSLIHDGRFVEARAIEKEVQESHFQRTAWLGHQFRLHQGERNWPEVEKIIAEVRKTDKARASYLAALMYLDREDPARAAAEVDVLRQEQQKRKTDRLLEQRFWETQGRLFCKQGQDQEGCKLLQRTVDRIKNDYQAHSWGNGGYWMEQWGIGALEAGNATIAEEAFLEALAHDAGSVRGALGMQALCDRLGRHDEAHRFALVADRCWRKADRKDLDSLRADMYRKAARIHPPSSATSARQSNSP